jgi:hypothetical protein
LVAESVSGPDTALSSTAVNTVDKAKALGLLSIRTLVFRITQKTRRHARPAGEDNKSDEVAHSHGSSTGLVESRTSSHRIRSHTASGITAMSGGGEVVEDNKEGNGARDMDE